MPWEVRQKGAQHCVVKEGGEVVKCHPTREKALAHLRAIYANYPKKLRKKR